ncbi:uncharacterized protein EI90DRAFT_2231284 [Cantharellus anzutake]|uniref:uncharacterized protein n=1 Tax=Cantharellus anzutake TaxID=1750568 RepID=UPI001904AF22|nr:uncharacterized protein EI90DRAFT_2231284 [Cantharellus anzutake]KAF8324780.1 hypothetical protein EI90DRAFT_2231284 [Cantharellus anzutake]
MPLLPSPLPFFVFLAVHSPSLDASAMNSPTATFARLSLHSPAVTNQDINPLAHHTSNKRKRSYDIPSSSNFATTSTPSTSSAQPTPDSGLIRCICGYTDDDGLTIFCDMCGYWQHMSCVLSNPPPLLKDDSATASDDDQTSSSTTSSRSSSKGKSTKPPTSTSSITSAALPEQWFCERCVPRPVDASAARARQTRRLQADRERLFRAAGIVEQIPNGRKKSRPENIDKRRRSTVTGTQQITTESVRRSKSGTSSRKPTSNRNRSSSVDISPLDEDTMFEPWANEFVRINQDVIADEGVRQAIRHWRSSIEGNTRDSPTSSSRSQPPMPISPVTECSPLPPLPSIKVPPVRLLVKQVPPSECQPIPTPTIASLPPPNATPSYHDNTLHNSDPKSLSYGRPPTYGVYTSNSTSGTIPAGTLLATFVSRIIPVSAYTCAPLSQYALLQLPKPHVRLIPPPLSLALDAREMGNESRFIRNGCHPNAVIRPVISESSPAGVEWGVYSMRSISAKGEEIVLGWEWDANSPVQLLNDVLENGCADVQGT